MSAYVSVQASGGPMWVFKCSSLDEAESVMQKAHRVQKGILTLLHTQRPVASPQRRVYYLNADRLPAWFNTPSTGP